MFFVYKYSDQFSLFKLSYFMHDSNARDNTALISKMLILMCLLCIKSIVAILLFYAYTFGVCSFFKIRFFNIFQIAFYCVASYVFSLCA